MLVLGKLPIKENTDIKDLTQNLKTFSTIYIRNIFKNPRKLKNRPKLERLKKLETYIQTTYNIKQDILHIILYIIHSLKIDNKGLLYIKKEQINTIKIDKIYKLICFGNIEVRKSAIFNEAIKFGIKQTKRIKSYGC